MKSKLFKTLGILIAVSILLILPSVVLAADAYPSKPVRLIIPWLPGGSVDISGRLIALKLSERFGENVFVDNRAGAGSIIGTQLAAKQDPDGYKLLLASGASTIQLALRPELPYASMKFFTPIAKLLNMHYAFIVHPSIPANSVKELIELAKQTPGKLLFGTPGIGSSTHMSVELFKNKTDIDIKIVHYKGSGPSTMDLVGGHIHASFNSLVAALPYIKSGKVRVLGTCGLKRSGILPDVPTMMEAGVPGYEAGSWYGILAPAGTPAPIVERLNKELKVILASDEIKKQFLNRGAEVDYLGPTEFGIFFEEQVTKWTDLVKKANIKVQ